MIELPLVLLGGLLGSAHCVGMCGGFALMVGAGSNRFTANVVRQLVYSAGRIFTYMVLGGALGFAGLRLTEDLPSVVQVQAILAIVAGLLLIGQGIAAAGLWPRAMFVRRATAPSVAGANGSLPLTVANHASVGCLMGGMLGSYLRAPSLAHVLLAGVLTGFLPCGLVYGFLALAASSSSFALGSGTMVAFGLGTVPLMVLAGSGVSLVSIAARQRLLRVAAVCVILTGMISLARGVGFLDLPYRAQPASCPLCR
jgi:sulfite exporter TauE/SafE